jgi:hypothetical protein
MVQQCITTNTTRNSRRDITFSPLCLIVLLWYLFFTELEPFQRAQISTQSLCWMMIRSRFVHANVNIHFFQPKSNDPKNEYQERIFVMVSLYRSTIAIQNTGTTSIGTSSSGDSSGVTKTTHLKFCQIDQVQHVWCGNWQHFKFGS